MPWQILRKGVRCPRCRQPVRTSLSALVKAYVVCPDCGPISSAYGFVDTPAGTKLILPPAPLPVASLAIAAICSFVLLGMILFFGEAASPGGFWFFVAIALFIGGCLWIHFMEMYVSNQDVLLLRHAIVVRRKPALTTPVYRFACGHGVSFSVDVAEHQGTPVLLIAGDANLDLQEPQLSRRICRLGQGMPVDQLKELKQRLLAHQAVCAEADQNELEQQDKQEAELTSERPIVMDETLAGTRVRSKPLTWFERIFGLCFMGFAGYWTVGVMISVGHPFLGLVGLAFLIAGICFFERGELVLNKRQIELRQRMLGVLPMGLPWRRHFQLDDVTAVVPGVLGGCSLRTRLSRHPVAFHGAPELWLSTLETLLARHGWEPKLGFRQEQKKGHTHLRIDPAGLLALTELTGGNPAAMVFAALMVSVIAIPLLIGLPLLLLTMWLGLEELNLTIVFWIVAAIAGWATWHLCQSSLHLIIQPTTDSRPTVIVKRHIWRYTITFATFHGQDGPIQIARGYIDDDPGGNAFLLLAQGDKKIRLAAGASQATLTALEDILHHLRA